MATFQAIFVPGKVTKVAALAGTTSSAEIVMAKDMKFAIVATGAINIAFGQSGMSAADATGWYIPASATIEFDLGNAYTSIRVFNSTASAIDVYILVLSN